MELPPGELPEWMRSAGPFLLYDRDDPAHIFEAPAATTPPKDFTDFVSSFEPFSIDQAKWNKMRADFERGAIPQARRRPPAS